MKKITVFGKPGSGKSTLSSKLALATGIKLYALDAIEFEHSGKRVEAKIFIKEHEGLLSTDSWIIEGFGPIGAFYERLAAADTLIYIDLSYSMSYWLVTKRLLKGLFVKPAGWPDGSSILTGTLASYKTLKLCPMFWNDQFVQRLESLSSTKTVYVIRSVKELNDFVDQYVR